MTFEAAYLVRKGTEKAVKIRESFNGSVATGLHEEHVCHDDMTEEKTCVIARSYHAARSVAKGRLEGEGGKGNSKM